MGRALQGNSQRFQEKQRPEWGPAVQRGRTGGACERRRVRTDGQLVSAVAPNQREGTDEEPRERRQVDRHPENREGCTISKKSQAQGGVRCSGEEEDGGPGSGRPASTGRNPGQMGGPPHSARVSSLFSLCPSAPGGKGGVLTLPLPGTPPSSPVQPPQGAPRQLPKLLLPELHGGCAHAGPLPIPPPAGPGGRVRDPGVRPGPARPRSSAWGESG